nr:hypothetical protein Q903MT_gene3690 [Picea sitchensis]
MTHRTSGNASNLSSGLSNSYSYSSPPGQARVKSSRARDCSSINEYGPHIRNSTEMTGRAFETQSMRQTDLLTYSFIHKVVPNPFLNEPYVSHSRIIRLRSDNTDFSLYNQTKTTTWLVGLIYLRCPTEGLCPSPVRPSMHGSLYE